MKFQLNGSEMADWMENWCFLCVHDHDCTHGDENAGNGCPLLLKCALGEDVPEFEPRHPDWWRMIPAEVSCSNFERCTKCPSEDPDAERRGGETRTEFHDRLRAETLARPVVPA